MIGSAYERVYTVYIYIYIYIYIFIYIYMYICIYAECRPSQFGSSRERIAVSIKQQMHNAVSKGSPLT